MDQFEEDVLFVENIKVQVQSSDAKGDALEAALRDTLKRYERLLRTTKRLVRIGDLIQEKQRQAAQTDSLTDVDNRRAFLANLKREIGRSHRFQHPLALLFLDIDHFKKINDTHGHDMGDVALRAFARTVMETLRGIDLLGRLGGEEFAVILPETDKEGAHIIAERIRQRVADIRIELDSGDSFQFTVSIGAACYQREVDTDSVLLERADKALYRAKNSGRNQVVFDA